MLARRVLELDFDEIEKWFDKHHLKMPAKGLFPRIGFIVNGVAAGFIYSTDSLVSIIDCYISNPHIDAQTRDKALNAITDELIKSAKSHGCKIIKCDTKLESIKHRALAHGFKSLGAHESLSMEI